MAGAYRGPAIRADFADVPDTIGRDTMYHLGEETSAGGAAEAPLGSASSFDFLQALDGIAEPRTEIPQASHDGFAGLYADLSEAAPEDARPQPEPAVTALAEAHSPPPVEPEPEAQSCDPAAVAAELGLRPGLKAAELKRIRRAFALENHPDRLDPSRRELASRRMTLANALIDEALRQTKPDR